MERRGQGAIEYLLIIGAAILVVAIVIVAITSVVSTNPNPGSDANKANNLLKCTSDITILGGAVATSCTGTPPYGSACNCCNSLYVTNKDSLKTPTGTKYCS
jgi:hypothetical protein